MRNSTRSLRFLLVRSSFVFLLAGSPFVVLSSALAGCASTNAAPVRHEPLAVPPPPPRVIAPAAEEPEASTGTEPAPVPNLPRTQRPAARDTKPPAGTQQPQAEPPAATATESEGAKPAPPLPPPQPAPELRTVESPDDGKATKLVRDTLESASKRLSGIDYQALPKGSQLQYDMAKRFIEQSEEALKVRNYTAAQLMAEKAETIARELAGR